MSRRGLSAASLTAAVLAFSLSPAVAVAGGGYHGGYGGYHGGYHGYYGRGPAIGIGIGFYGYDYAPAYVYTPPPVVVAAPPPAVSVDAPPLPVPAPDPADGCARMQVLVPADAEVWFDGNPTATSGEQREFTSPALVPGRDYQYRIRARWTEAGRVVDQTRTVAVRANARVGVDFSRPETVPAPLPFPDSK